MLITLSLLTWFSGSLHQELDWQVLLKGVQLAVLMMIYVYFPLLVIQFLYSFYRVLKLGRKPDISIWCYQTLFNPLNFLIFPSLLNRDGLFYRRRCIVALLLLVLLYLMMIVIS